jgi:hypothetical protein
MMRTSGQVHEASGLLAVNALVDCVHDLNPSLRDFSGRLPDADCEAAFATKRRRSDLGRPPRACSPSEHV